MGPLVLLGLAAAGGVAYNLSKKRAVQGVQVAPGVHVITPTPTAVTLDQQHATPRRPRQPSTTVALPKRPPASGNPGPSAQISISATTTSQGIGYAPPNVTSVGQPAPIVSTAGGQASVLIMSVKDVQNALNTLGYTPKLKADNAMGPKTAANIAKFQSAVGLPITSSADPMTKAALSAALVNLAAGPRISVGEKAETVTPENAPALTNKQIQQYLNLAGANPQLQQDGNLGPKSIAALKTFQLTHGLVADGVAGPKTRAALVIAARGQ